MSGSWQYHLLKGLSAFAGAIPYPVLLRLGRWVGILGYHIDRRRCRRAVLHVEERLGLSLGEAKVLVRRLCIHVSQSAFEFMATPSMTLALWRERVKIEHREYLESALAQGKGVIVLSGHFGNWEWMGSALAMEGFPVISIVKPQPNAVYNELLWEYRRMTGIQFFIKGTRETTGILKALRKNKMVSFFLDQDAGRSGSFVNFFGKPASTHLGAAVFAHRSGAPVVPMFVVRQPDGGHKIVMQPPLYFAGTGDEADLLNFTARLTGIIEAQVRQHPDQWFWFQKRWRTQPIAGEADEKK